LIAIHLTVLNTRQLILLLPIHLHGGRRNYSLPHHEINNYGIQQQNRCKDMYAYVSPQTCEMVYGCTLERVSIDGE
jgi:hypothetical protein